MNKNAPYVLTWIHKFSLGKKKLIPSQIFLTQISHSQVNRCCRPAILPRSPVSTCSCRTAVKSHWLYFPPNFMMLFKRQSISTSGWVIYRVWFMYTQETLLSILKLRLLAQMDMFSSHIKAFSEWQYGRPRWHDYPQIIPQTECLHFQRWWWPNPVIPSRLPTCWWQ